MLLMAPRFAALSAYSLKFSPQGERIPATESDFVDRSFAVLHTPLRLYTFVSQGVKGIVLRTSVS